MIFAALVSSASPLLADSLTLTAPMAGGTLHERGADLTAYWLADGAGYDLRVVYLTGEQTTPAPLRMQLVAGDAVSFGLPGQDGVLYTFAADAEGVQITARPAAREFAQQ